ncbi:MAG: glycosyltransferase family 4 protein, partial [Hyphomicrobiales bacterium]
SQRSLSGQIYFGVERLMERLTCEFIFVAGYEVETYSRKISKLRQPWSIAYNGLSAEEFNVVKPSARAVDFVYAGHMRDLKGADLFIDAIEIANARSSDPVHALMIGDGEDLPRYKEDVQRRGLTDRIQFLAPMPIRDVFKRTRNLVVPSRAEALPYIVVEALGARVPTLSTSVGGIPEIYGSYGHYLLPPGDANLIATAMLDRLSRPEKASDLAGTLRQIVKQKFTVEGMCKKVDKVYLRNLAKVYLPEVDRKEYFKDDEDVDTGIYANS